MLMDKIASMIAKLQFGVATEIVRTMEVHARVAHIQVASSLAIGKIKKLNI